MAAIMRVKVKWSGYQGAPGYNIFHYRDFDTEPPTNTHATAAATDLRAFFDAIKAYMPNAVKIDVMPDCDVLESSTGDLTGGVTATPGAQVSGTAGAGAQFAAAAGAVVTWKTAGVRNNRRIRGRSFIVPLANVAFATDGTLDAGFLTTAGTAATTLRDPTTGSPDLGVWARPTPVLDGEGNPTGEHNADGIWYVCNGHSIPDMGAVLRSRRD